MAFCLLNVVTNSLKKYFFSSSSSSLVFFECRFSVDCDLREGIESNGRQSKRTQDSAQEVRSWVMMMYEKVV